MLKKATVAAALAVCGIAVGVPTTVAQAASRPSSVTCLSPVTGPIGGTGAIGPDGATGPKGDTGFFDSGAPRSVHVRGLKAPNCVDIVGVCLAEQQTGAVGATGPAGPTGPKGDTGDAIIGGPGRSAHIRQVNPCAGVPRECQYGVRGQVGATGPTGGTGQKGPKGDAAPPLGPRRSAHVRPAGTNYPIGGSVITLEDCNLPTTGGSSTPMLPYALLLVALGGVAVMIADRRRVLRRS